jgi:hypothetical protein
MSTWLDHGGILAKELAGGGVRKSLRWSAAGYLDREIRSTSRRTRVVPRPEEHRARLRSQSATARRKKPCRCAASGSFLPGGVAAQVYTGQPHLALDHMELALHARGALRQVFQPAAVSWGITYDELEDLAHRSEHTARRCRRAGNIRGQIVAGGNPLKRRARRYPLPRSARSWRARCSTAPRAARAFSFSAPLNASRAYTNPDGSKFSAPIFPGSQRWLRKRTPKRATADSDPNRDA